MIPFVNLKKEYEVIKEEIHQTMNRVLEYQWFGLGHELESFRSEYLKDLYHLYVISSKDRDKLKTYLKKNKIQTLIHYPIPIHQQKAYFGIGQHFNYR